MPSIMTAPTPPPLLPLSSVVIRKDSHTEKTSFSDITAYFDYFQVLLVVPSAVPFAPSKLIKHSVYNVSFSEDYIEKVLVPMAFNHSHSNVLEAMQMWTKHFADTCTSVISLVKNHSSDLKGYDLIFADSPPSCGSI